MAQATIRILGNPTEAIGAMNALGIKFEETGAKAESSMGVATSKIGAMFKRLGEQAAQFGFEAGEALAVVGDKMAETEVKGKGLGNTLGGIGKAVFLGLAGGGVVIAGLGIKAAVAAQQVEAQLKVAIEGAGASMEELEPKIRATDASMRQFGFTNNETNTALTTMTRGLGNPTEAMKAMSVAADLARAKNIDLNTAAMLVTKAMEGQTKPLKQLGIDLPVYAGGAQAVHMAQLSLAKSQESLTQLLQKSPGAVDANNKAHSSYVKALEAVHLAQDKLTSVQHTGEIEMAAIEKRTHGAADAYGNTFAGQVAKAKAQLDNMAEVIGAKLLPILTNLMKDTENVINWFSKHKVIAEALAGVIGGALAIAMGVSAVNGIAKFGKSISDSIAVLDKMKDFLIKGIATIGEWVIAHGAATVSIVAENAAQAASATAAFVAENAATLGIVAGIAALVAAIVWVGMHWHQVWGAIKEVARAVWNDGIRPVFEAIKHGIELYITTEIQVLETIWKSAWGAITTVAQTVWNDGIKPIWNAIGDGVNTLVVKPIQTLSQVWNDIWGGIWSVIHDVWNAIEPILQAMQSALDKVGNAIGKVTGTIGKIGHGIGKVLGFADGGRPPVGQVSIVGEHGPEFFIPDQAGTIIPSDQTVAMLKGAAATGAPLPVAATGKAGGVSLTVVNGAPMDANQLANEIGWQLKPYLAGA